MFIEVKTYAWHNANEVSRVWREVIGNTRAACDVRVPGLPDSVTQIDPAFDRLRWSLTEAELDRYRILGKEVADSLETACKQVHPGMSEHELAGKVAAACRQRGIRTPVLLMAADERVKRYRHPLATGTFFCKL